MKEGNGERERRRDIIGNRKSRGGIVRKETEKGLPRRWILQSHEADQRKRYSISQAEFDRLFNILLMITDKVRPIWCENHKKIERDPTTPPKCHTTHKENRWSSWSCNLFIFVFYENVKLFYEVSKGQVSWYILKKKNSIDHIKYL